MITVAIIDDGIFEEDNLIIKESIEIGMDLKIQYKPTIKKISSIHGTTCARIIKKYYEKVQFVSIKVINDRSKKGDI